MATRIDRVIWRYEADTRQAEAGTRRLAGSIEGATQRTNQFNKALKVAGTVIATIGAGALVKDMLELAAANEKVEKSFAKILGSTKAAQRVLGSLEEFAAGTNFSLVELQDTALKLLRKVGPTGIEDVLRRLGDIANGTNNSIEDLGNVYAKILNKGKAQAEELLQLTERGVPIIDVLAEMFGKTGDEIFKMGSRSEITADVITKAFNQMTDAGGDFAGLTAEMAETTSGKLSTLKDNWEAVRREAGERLLPVLNALLDIGLKLFGANQKQSDAIRDQKTELNLLVGVIGEANESEEERLEKMNDIEAAYPSFFEGLDKHTIGEEELRKRLDAVNKELDERIDRMLVLEEIETRQAERQDIQNTRLETAKKLQELMNGRFKEAVGETGTFAERLEKLTEHLEGMGVNVPSAEAGLLELGSTMGKTGKVAGILGDLLGKDGISAALFGVNGETANLISLYNAANLATEKWDTRLDELNETAGETAETVGNESKPTSLAGAAKTAKKAVEELDTSLKEINTRDILFGIEGFERISDEFSELMPRLKEIAAEEGFDPEDILPTREIIEGAETLGDDLKASFGVAAKEIGEELAEELRKAIESATQIVGSSMEIIGSLINIGREREVRELEKQKAKELAIAGNNAIRREAIETKFAEKREELERKAFEEQKKFAEAQAIINGSLAVTKILAEVPKADFGVATALLIAAAIATTAEQLATIRNTQFAEGGFVSDGRGGYTGPGHKYKPVGIVHAGEYVMPAANVAHNRKWLEMIHRHDLNIGDMVAANGRAAAAGSMFSDNRMVRELRRGNDIGEGIYSELRRRRGGRRRRNWGSPGIRD